MNTEAQYSPPTKIEALPKLRMIARKGLNLSDETLRKMNEE
jgi:hypothetical protein